MFKFILPLLLLTNVAFAEDDGFVHHPTPKDPVYIKASKYEVFKSQLPALPQPNSQEQLSDEKELFHLQNTRTSQECALAKEEVLVSLKSFYGEPRGSLKDADVNKLTGFFEQVRNDGDYFIQRMKKDFPRERPFNYIKGLSPCVAKEVTLAYPSGHAALSKLYALILSDFFPADKAKFEARAIEIGRHRVLSGMHHPTDIESGRKLAELIYKELKKSKKYQDDFKKLAKDYLAMDLPYEPFAEIFKKLQIAEKKKLINRGEAHITVITPIEYHHVLRPKGVSIEEIDQIAKDMDIQNSNYEVLCLGLGEIAIDGNLEQTYYLVVQSEDLLNLRMAIYRLFLSKGGSKVDFDPAHYYPHITIGFTKRDLHESDGVIKDSRSCI